MSLVIITSNIYNGEYDFTDAKEAHFVVITGESFETKWKAFKEKCLENFVNYHIRFIIPQVEHPECVKDFLFRYGTMLGFFDEEMRVYD